LSDALVLDIGANVGSWTAALLRVAPTARVIAIEPHPEPRAILANRFANDPRVRIEPRPLSREAGPVLLRITGHSANASLLQPCAEMQEAYGRPSEWQVKDTLELTAATVDEITAGDSVTLLKIDVQGAELDVLAGAELTLRHTAAVLVEVLFTAHYEGGAEFADVHATMRENGFGLFALSEPFLSVTHRALWADACYVTADRPT
jgi:FkbM family methyltransferase